MNQQSFSVTDFKQTKERMLNWANRFSIFCFLDNHNYQIPPHSVECLLAVGVKRSIQCREGNALQKLQDFIDGKNGWFFGHLSYDLKNEIEQLSSANTDTLGFPQLYFFEPAVVVRLNETEMRVEADNPQQVVEEINNMAVENSALTNPVKIKSRISKDEYCETINKLKQHILRGDCYEINFCQEFYAVEATINPVLIYKKLSDLSPNPFSALYKLDERWLLCASPERYLKKTGERILSQPIKGTAKRDLVTKDADDLQRNNLFNSAKDRSENVMVVDLVRNDLAKVCKEGTVKVDELYGIYSFPQVHQMISTVSGELNDGISFSEIIRATFPMGSMTGAPKKRVMELIEQFEKSRRGLFSGAVGYIAPGGDFDFNVVIRSILYNEKKKYLSFQAGSGITFYSDPEKEWEECEMKAGAIKKVLE